VGEPKEDMARLVAHTRRAFPRIARVISWVWDAGRHRDAVSKGFDMFDCVLPTRNARNGWLFTRFGDVKIKNARPSLRYPAAGQDLPLLRLREFSAAATCTTCIGPTRSSARASTPSTT
jgi:queuine tRNA-ribosyltransferase